MTSKAVDAPVSSIPDLRPTPALQLTAEDIALPRLHVCQFSSKAFQAKLVDAGEIYSSVGQDDQDPETLAQPLRVHVIGMRKGKSFAEDGELQRFDFDDPDAPAGAWVTYDYSMVLPDYDATTPYKFLLTKSATPAARQMNAVLIRASRPLYEIAFEITTDARENPKGKFWVPRVKVVEATQEASEIAGQLYELITPQGAEAAMGSGNDTPEI